MRLNEIVNLRWENVDLKNKIITVGDETFITKGKNQRFIPISEEVETVIEKCQRGTNVTHIGNSYLFIKSNGQKYTGEYFAKRFKSACRKAEIDKAIHFHSLRHSFASNLVQQGVSLYKIKELLGHSSITTTEIYSHLNIDSLRDAISVFDEQSSRSSLSLSPRSRLGNEGKNGNEKYTSGLKLIVNNRPHP